MHAATADGIPDDVRFDLIWSNPPIRVGKAVLHELLRTWLPRLAPGGVAHLVVQRNLGSDSLQTVDRDRARDAVHPAHLEQGLPGARGEAAMTPTTTPALGVVLVPTLPPEALRPLAAAADRHLDELWLWEDCFKESAIAAAGAALAWTERVRVGIGLAPVPLRNVALLAMELATLHRLFPGRLLPGIGHGVQDWMGQVGARAASPLTLLREYAEALRLLLDGHEVTVSGRYVSLDRVRLDWPPEPGTPLLVGGTGPRTLELAGRVGDGILIGSVDVATPSSPTRSRRHAPAGSAPAVRTAAGCRSSPT